MYIFLDESGQFSKNNNEKYFIVASFTVGDPRRTEKGLRGFYNKKFPKKMRNQSEIKFANKKITDSLRIKTVKFISGLDVRINYVYLLKKNIPENFFKKDKLLSGHLYTHIIAEVLEKYLPINDSEFRVFCDKRHLKGIKQSDFKRILKSHLLPLLPANTNIETEMVDSASSVNIQIADWIVGVLARDLEDKELGSELKQILKNNILNEGKELFKTNWEDDYKQKTQSDD